MRLNSTNKKKISFFIRKEFSVSQLNFFKKVKIEQKDIEFLYIGIMAKYCFEKEYDISILFKEEEKQLSNDLSTPKFRSEKLNKFIVDGRELFKKGITKQNILDLIVYIEEFKAMIIKIEKNGWTNLLKNSNKKRSKATNLLNEFNATKSTLLNCGALKNLENKTDFINLLKINSLFKKMEELNIDKDYTPIFNVDYSNIEIPTDLIYKDKNLSIFLNQAKENLDKSGTNIEDMKLHIKTFEKKEILLKEINKLLKKKKIDIDPSIFKNILNNTKN